jgi:uncharacterized protein YndB with AHSA1/START domain
MPGFDEHAVCRAPATEVWKLLYDPGRYTEWWTGTEHIQHDEDSVVRYTDAWPGFAFPTAIDVAREGERVTISCVLTDIVYRWALEPRPEGCALSLRVEIPESEAALLGPQMEAMRSSVERLVAAAERAAGGR